MTASVRLELQKELAKLTERKPNNHECIKRAAEIVWLDHDRYPYRRGDLRNCQSSFGFGGEHERQAYTQHSDHQRINCGCRTF